MNDQQQSRADALTDERAAFPRYTEWLHLRTHGEWSNGVPEWARDHTGRMNDCTAASAVIEELAAARASANEATRPTAYHFHRFVDGVEMAEGVLIERAPTLEAAIKEAVRCCEKRPMTVLVHAPAWAGTLCGGALANRAASANETGAEGVSLAMALNPNAPPLTMTLGPAQAAEAVAQWQSRLKDRSSPVVDHWVNISPDGAKTLMEKYANVYEVRALYTAPQPPAQADAREGLTDERIAHIAAAHTNSVVEFDRLLKFARALLKGADHAE